MFGKVRRHGSVKGIILGGLALIVALTAVVAGGAQAAKPGNSENAKACQKGGWEDMARSTDYSGFSSEQECTSYAAEGGTLVNPLALCQQQLADANLTAPANANYVLGTPGDENFTSQITAGNDVVCGFAGNDRIDGDNNVLGADIVLGGDGNDRVNELDKGATFNGGAGNDAVDHSESATFNGGDGNDFVRSWDGFTFNGGAGDDVVQDMQNGTFNGGDGNDSIGEVIAGVFNGGDGNDRVAEFSSGGTFNGGEGDDHVGSLGGDSTFNGEGGCDTVGHKSGGTFNQGEPCPS